MRNGVNQAIIGEAVVSIAQLEKAIDGLVEKGETSETDATALVHHLMAKGTETKTELDVLVQEKIRNILNEMHLVTRDELKALEQLIEEIKRKL